MNSMIFQSYLDNIESKTGKSPADFKKLAEKKGFTVNGELRVKATEIVNWAKKDFALGHGHAMAIYCLLKDVKKSMVVNGKTVYLDQNKEPSLKNTSKRK